MVASHWGCHRQAVVSCPDMQPVASTPDGDLSDRSHESATPLFHRERKSQVGSGMLCGWGEGEGVSVLSSWRRRVSANWVEC